MIEKIRNYCKRSHLKFNDSLQKIIDHDAIEDENEVPGPSTISTKTSDVSEIDKITDDETMLIRNEKHLSDIYSKILKRENFISDVTPEERELADTLMDEKTKLWPKMQRSFKLEIKEYYIDYYVRKHIRQI